MLLYIMIGLMCNSSECYWVQIENKEPTVFTDYKLCKGTADLHRATSIMYFDTNCMVKP